MKTQSRPSFVVIFALFALVASGVQAALLDGYVTDTGHGWPLYARIDISDGAPVTTVYTDPFTGFYSIDLPDGVAYTLDVEVQYPGYDPDQRAIVLAPGGQAENFQPALAVDCSAPGYFLNGDCHVVSGAMVLGYVADDNTHSPLIGAVVSSDTGGQTETMATPDDDAVGEGFYALFAYMPGLAPSDRTITATATRYASFQVTQTFTPDAINRLDFSLEAGSLDVMPIPLDSRVDAGLEGLEVLSFVNTGEVPAQVGLSHFAVPNTFDPPTFGRIEMPVAPVVNDLQSFDPETTAASGLAPRPAGLGDVIATWPTSQLDGWGIGLNQFAQRSWVGGFLAERSATEHEHDGVESGATSTYDAISGAFDWAYDPVKGTYWLNHADIADYCVYELDPATGLTGETICPAFPTYQRGLAYDPLTDTFFAGDWDTDSIYRFSRDGTILEAVPVSDGLVTVGAAGLAYNPESGHLFAIEAQSNATDLFVLDVNASYAVVGHVDLSSTVVTGAGLTINCRGELLAVDQADTSSATDSTVVVLDSGEEGVCSWRATEWLVFDEYDFTVPAGNAPGQVDINAHFLSYEVPDEHFGLFKAQVFITEDTPYEMPVVPAYMTKAFLDVPYGAFGDAQIHGLAGIRVTAGCGNGEFCPDAQITRKEMAVFLVKLARGIDFVPPAAVGIFDDVDPVDYGVFADFIEQLSTDGITAGCGGGNFCPDGLISRAELAVFVCNAKGWTPLAPTGVFEDVPTDHWAAGHIERIADEGVTAGCGGGNFCPEGLVSRAEMAIFLVNAWNVETFQH